MKQKVLNLLFTDIHRGFRKRGFLINRLLRKCSFFVVESRDLRVDSSKYIPEYQSKIYKYRGYRCPTSRRLYSKFEESFGCHCKQVVLEIFMQMYSRFDMRTISKIPSDITNDIIQ